MAAAMAEQLQVSHVPEARVGLAFMWFNVVTVQGFEHLKAFCCTEGIAGGCYTRDGRTAHREDAGVDQGAYKGPNVKGPSTIIATAGR